jgi:hypothetical protein
MSDSFWMSQQLRYIRLLLERQIHDAQLISAKGLKGQNMEEVDLSHRIIDIVDTTQCEYDLLPWFILAITHFAHLTFSIFLYLGLNSYYLCMRCLRERDAVNSFPPTNLTKSAWLHNN